MIFMSDVPQESAKRYEGGPRFFQRIEDLYEFFGLKKKVNLDTEEGKKTLLERMRQMNPQNSDIERAHEDVLRNYRQLKAEQEFNKNTAERVPESTWEKIKQTLKKHKILLTFLGIAAIAGGLYWWNPVVTIGGVPLALRTLVANRTVELWEKMGGPEAWKKLGGPEKLEWVKKKALEVKAVFNEQLKKLGIGKDAAPAAPKRPYDPAYDGPQAPFDPSIKSLEKAASSAEKVGGAAAGAAVGGILKKDEKSMPGK